MFTPGEFPRMSKGNLTTFLLNDFLKACQGENRWQGAFNYWGTIDDKYLCLNMQIELFKHRSQTSKKLPITHLFLEICGSHWRHVYYRVCISLRKKAVNRYVCGYPQGSIQLYRGMSDPGYHCSSDTGVWMQCSEHMWYYIQVVLEQHLSCSLAGSDIRHGCFPGCPPPSCTQQTDFSTPDSSLQPHLKGVSYHNDNAKIFWCQAQ